MIGCSLVQAYFAACTVVPNIDALNGNGGAEVALGYRNEVGSHQIYLVQRNLAAVRQKKDVHQTSCIHVHLAPAGRHTVDTRMELLVW